MLQVYADSTIGITQEDEFIIPENISVSIDCDDSKFIENLDVEENYDKPVEYGIEY